METLANTDWIEIGTIVAPQGLKGEMRILSNSDFPQRFEQPGKRWLQSGKGETPVTVELIRGREIPGKNLYIIKLKDIDDRNSAEALRGYKLMVTKGDRLPLAPDEYHVSDLIGLDVYHQLTSEKIGVIKDIFSAGNDIIEVQLINSKNEDILESTKKQKHPKKTKTSTILVPFVKEIVPIVNLKAGLIEINPPPGLLDINQEN